MSQSTMIRQVEDAEDEEANARICHTTHTEPCEQSSAGHAGLLLALSMHALFEGLAIGVQDSASKVLVLLGAVCCHKFVVGFCLGVELSSSPGSRLRNLLIAIFVFASGSVVGIGVGMGLTDFKDIYDGPALQVLQAIAAGTLLYVTVCEVLPREKAKWHMSRRRFAGVFQCISVLIGFGAMSLLTIYYGKKLKSTVKITKHFLLFSCLNTSFQRDRTEAKKRLKVFFKDLSCFRKILK